MNRVMPVVTDTSLDDLVGPLIMRVFRKELTVETSTRDQRRVRLDGTTHFAAVAG